MPMHSNKDNLYKPKLKESEIQHQIIEYLKWKKIYHWRNNSGRIRLGKNGRERWMVVGKAGLPDILCILPPHGRLVGIEVKSASGKLTNLQRYTLAELEKLGVICGVARSVEDAQIIVGKHGGEVV